MRFKDPQVHRKGLVTWRLVPMNVEHPLWTASTLVEAVHVRARSATEARLIAARQLASTAGANLPRALMSPWLDHNLSLCVRLPENVYGEIDVAGVIDGAGRHHEFRP